MTGPDDVVERNIRLVGNVMQYLLDKPQVLGALPENFELVILPDDDPEIRVYNLELLDKYGGDDKPVVFARVKSTREMFLQEEQPSLYIPLAA